MYIGSLNFFHMLKTVSIAGIEEEGVPFKKESIPLEDAAKTVSTGNLTWIECVVDDILTKPQKFCKNLKSTWILVCYFQDM